MNPIVLAWGPEKGRLTGTTYFLGAGVKSEGSEAGGEMGLGTVDSQGKKEEELLHQFPSSPPAPANFIHTFFSHLCFLASPCMGPERGPESPRTPSHRCSHSSAPCWCPLAPPGSSHTWALQVSTLRSSPWEPRVGG